MTDHDLTRYALGAKPATSGPPVTGMWPSSDGDWVKHDEAAARIADLQRQLDVAAALLQRHDEVHLRLDVPYCDETTETIADAYSCSGLAEDTSDFLSRIKTTQPKEPSDV